MIVPFVDVGVGQQVHDCRVSPNAIKLAVVFVNAAFK
jgi:hypothetical protein